MDEQQTYLDLLKFDTKLLSSLPGRYLKNIRLMMLLLLGLVVMGTYSYITLDRTLYPEVNIPIVLVQTVLPGAGPEDVEALITKPIEKEIKSIKGVNTYTSASQDNVSVVSVEFESQFDAKEARDEVQSAVDSVTNLPEDAQNPIIQELDFENVPVLDFVLIKKEKTKDVASLQRIADDLKTAIEDIPYVDRVDMNGYDKREIQIQVKPAFVEEKNIDPITFSQTLQAALSSYPAGNVQTNTSQFSLTIEQPIQIINDIRQTPITFGQNRYVLEEIADIFETSASNQPSTYFANQDREVQPAITFSVFKTSDAQIDDTAQEVQKKIDQVLEKTGDTYETKTVINYADLIDKQFGDLINNFYQTLLLVFLSMFLLYGIRQASIASFAIPFSLFIVFVSMKITNITLNFISIFSLLIALGLFVDNAVVIIEAYTSYYRSGKFTPLQTAILVWKDFFVELFSINLLTIWAFLPLLITTGIIGEFIKPLPIIVSIAMMSSVAVAVLFTLPAMMILTQFSIAKRIKIALGILFGITFSIALYFVLPNSILKIPTIIIILFSSLVLFYIQKQLLSQTKQAIKSNRCAKKIASFSQKAFDKGFIRLDSLSQQYKKVVTKLLEKKSLRLQVLAFIILFTIASYALIPLGLLQQEFFPKSNEEEVYIQLELPAGTPLDTTTQRALEITNQVRAIPDALFITTRIQSTAGFGVNVAAPQSNQAVITIKLSPSDERKKTSIEIAQELREKFKNYSSGNIQIVETTGGPPAGEDLEINIAGDDLTELQHYADQTMLFLSNLEGTANVNKSIKQGTSKIVFIPDTQKLKQYTINERTIGVWLRTLVSGFQLDTLTIDENDYDIILKLHKGTISPDNLNLLRIPVPTTSSRTPMYTSLQELGTFELKPNPTIITRENGSRTIKITAAALPGYIPTELNKELETFAKNELRLPSNYSWSVGGVNKENQKSMESIIQAMGISALLILATMVVQLGSFRKAVIVMLVIPLAVSGVFIWFSLTNTPLSFPAMVGLLSLFGIVIANSLMIVDKVNKNQEAGMNTKHAIIDASASRLEPIALTSISQIIGLIPVTLSDPLWRGLGGAIIAGLSFSGSIMLLFIPIAYYYFFPEENGDLKTLKKNQ